MKTVLGSFLKSKLYVRQNSNFAMKFYSFFFMTVYNEVKSSKISVWPGFFFFLSVFFVNKFSCKIAQF